MFTTQSYQQVDLGDFLGGQEKHWFMVEHDLGVPWFHVALDASGIHTPRTFLVSNSKVLEALVDTLEQNSACYQVQLVIPAAAPGFSRWSMRPLIRIERARDLDGKNAEIYTFDHGETLVFSESAGWDAGEVKHLEVFFEQKLGLAS
jgi:hypothetical protein